MTFLNIAEHLRWGKPIFIMLSVEILENFSIIIALHPSKIIKNCETLNQGDSVFETNTKLNNKLEFRVVWFRATHIWST